MYDSFSESTGKEVAVDHTIPDGMQADNAAESANAAKVTAQEASAPMELCADETILAGNLHTVTRSRARKDSQSSVESAPSPRRRGRSKKAAQSSDTESEDSQAARRGHTRVPPNEPLSTIAEDSSHQKTPTKPAVEAPCGRYSFDGGVN